MSKIKDFSKTKLNDNDKSSVSLKIRTICVTIKFINLTTEIEAIKMFIKEQFYVIKKALPTFQTIRNNKAIKKL